MLKVVVYDGGYGGELFADYLEENLPIVEVIRVIDWRNASAITKSARSARRTAKAALSPYLGQVDLIIFANHLLSITGLRYFRRHYPNQKFLGLHLEPPRRPHKRQFLILTTHAVAQTFNFHHFRHLLGFRTKTLCLDTWPAKIDDGELTASDISEAFMTASIYPHNYRDIFLACSQFSDLKPDLANYFHGQVKIYDSFDEALCRTCRILGIRGGTGKKRR